MKTSKSSQRSHKTMRESPPKKSHLSKKMRPRSPERSSGSSRPQGMQHSSMLKSTLRKHSNSPPRRLEAPSTSRSLIHGRHGSPGSGDRIHSAKHKYERKDDSCSPVSHPEYPGLSHGAPPQFSSYQSSRFPPRSEARVSSLYEPPPRKKPLREPVRYHSSSRSTSPVQRPTRSPHGRSRSQSIERNEKPLPSASHLGHQSRVIPSAHLERTRDSYREANRSRPEYPPSSKNYIKEEMPVKPAYRQASTERYRSMSPRERYSFPKQERYPTTLNERFRSVADTNRGSEPRIHYTKEDLEKITIDIHRNVREPSPTLRRITNPADVKLVHRPGTGHRPIFDREEIKQAPRDLREEAKLTYSSAPYGFHIKDIENYEITRHRFDTYQSSLGSTSRRTLNDRWQSIERRKDNISSDREERSREYDRRTNSRDSMDAQRQRSRSGDRDFRSQRYSTEGMHQRYDYSENHHPTYSRSNSPPRHSEVVHRKPEVMHRSQSKIAPRRSSEHDHFSDHSPSRSRVHPVKYLKIYSKVNKISKERDSVDRRDPNVDSRRSYHESHSKSRSRDEKLPDFSRRPDKYNYKPWLDKPDVTPKGPSYFEHDNRESSQFYRGRGSSRFRGYRGFRGTYRGSSSRGSMRIRGSFRGYASTSSRGRRPSRRGHFSPSLWKHDMYSRSSQDRKPDHRDM